jgi:PAS domain S-box-containing protein
METRPDKTNSQYNLLLVEDIPDHAHLMEIKLRAFDPNYQIEIVTSGSDCLEVFEQQNFDLVILDYILPGMSGLDTLKRLKFRYPELPVVLVTGQGDDKLAVQALKYGASDYIVKDKGYEKFLPQVVKQLLEKRQLEKMLIRSEIRYQTLFEQANDAIFLEESSQGDILDVNLKAAQLTGYTKAELLNLKFSDLVLFESSQNEKHITGTSAAAFRQQYDRVFILRKDKKKIPVDLGSNLVDQDNFQVIQNVVRDITEKRKFELLILESKKRLQALFDGITDFLTVQDRNFNIIMANQKIAVHCRTTPDKLIGKKCYRIYFGRKIPCENCPLVKTFHQGDTIFEEKMIQDEIFHLWSFPMRGVYDQMEYVIVHGKIVTEQKRLEKQFIQTEKLATIGILASGIAHELRNPLNVIETARYAINTEIDAANGSVLQKLNTIKEHVQRASKIINNLLQFSKPPLNPEEPIDIHQLLNSTLALVEKQMEVKGIRLERNFGPIPSVYFDLDALKQAFLNIIINAIQAMPDGGQLEIQTVKISNQKIQINFVDDGSGISEDNLKYIFTPFFTTKGRKHGTGLGMYICHSIIDRAGGEIALHSKLGKGTTVQISIPTQTKLNGRTK